MAKLKLKEQELLQKLQSLPHEEKNKKETKKEALNLIAEELFLDMVNTVEAHYNGEGDSGDFEELIFKDINDKEIKHKINDKLKDELLNALFYFLPGGWEINEGSYGVIYFDVRHKELKIAHEERIMETNYQEYKYTL